MVIKKNNKKSWISALIISVGLVSLSVLLRICLLNVTEFRLPYITLFPAVVFATLLGGLFSGLFATLLSSLYVIFWQSNGHHFLNDTIDWIGLSLFIFNAILITLITWKFIQAKSSEEVARAVKEITGLKRAEQRIRASEANLKAMYDNLPFLAWMKDVNGHYVYANKLWLNEVGFAALSEALGKTDFELWPKELAQHYRMIDQQVMQTRQQKRLVEQAINNGKEYFVETYKSPVIDEQGQILGVIGLARDVTEEREIEEKLKLAASIYEKSSEGMVVTDADNRIIAVNAAFTQITGYTAAEVIGKNPKILSSGWQDPAFYQQMWQAIHSVGFWQGEIRDKKKNGEMHTKKMTINVIHDDDGKIFRHIGLFSDITESKKNEALIWRQANYDPLTELPNRRLFLDRLEQEISKAEGAGTVVALLLIDLDRFKEVNDTLGHQAGDELLIEVAKRIVDCVNSVDTVSRLGGDEFMVILTDLHDTYPVETVAQKILAALQQPFKLENQLFFASGSIGITLYPNDAKTAEELVKNADQAMYVSKGAGRNQFNYFTSAMQDSAQAKLKLVGDLRNALEQGQFRLFYQPIVELSTGCIHKAEALIRWYHPTRGLVSPAEFIPLAEETGLIVDMGDWVFKEAANYAKYISKITQQTFQISVNKSPVQFHERKKSHDWLEYLAEIGLAPRQIVVELTEGLLLDSDASVVNRLLEYRDAGIEVAIDDFGTGYSSLSYLHKFDIDYLKIDQSFTRYLQTGSSEMAISEAIIVMAHKLGLRVIAEGVETEQQRNLLAAAGCDFVQGYLYSKPLPAADFEALLMKPIKR